MDFINLKIKIMKIINFNLTSYKIKKNIQLFLDSDIRYFKICFILIIY